MVNDLDHRVSIGMRAYADAVIVVPPAVSTVPIPRHPANRWARYGVPALVAAAVALIVALLPTAGLWPEPPAPAAPDQPARLPSRFASFSVLTGDLAKAPIGRAIAAYVQPNDVGED